MDRRAFIGAVALVPLLARGRIETRISDSSQGSTVECWGELPFDHPVVAFERWRDQAHSALDMGRHPETWQICEPADLSRVRAEYEHLLEISEQELPVLVYEWENA